MTPLILKIIFILIGLLLIYKLIFAKNKGPTLFTMHFEHGRLVDHKGKIPEKFQRECRAIAKAEKITCVIKAQKTGRGHVTLHVSANVSRNISQQIQEKFPVADYNKS